jgi:EF-hand domain pair
VFFEDYVSFTDVLTSSSIDRKAEYSFDMLDFSDAGYIDEDAISNMIESLFEVWNVITGNRVVVLREYSRRVFDLLDTNKDKRIDISEYTRMYAKEKLVFPWYDWLNQGMIHK